jgi:hypothetical protein
MQEISANAVVLLWFFRCWSLSEYRIFVLLNILIHFISAQCFFLKEIQFLEIIAFYDVASCSLFRIILIRRIHTTTIFLVLLYISSIPQFLTLEILEIYSNTKKIVVVCIWRIKIIRKSLWTTTGHDHTNFNSCSLIELDRRFIALMMKAVRTSLQWFVLCDKDETSCLLSNTEY